jgi:hypothetical protein
LILRGLWVRGEVRILVQNHGGARRQVDAGISLRRMPGPKLAETFLAVGAVLAVAAGAVSIAALLGAAATAVEAFVTVQAHILARVFYEAVDRSFRSLPLIPLRPQ